MHKKQVLGDTKREIEPDFQTACVWWPDLEDIWTPLGWKDHLFRFNVLFNGTIVAQPHMRAHLGLSKLSELANRRTVQWDGQGVQLTFVPSLDGRPRSYESYRLLVTRDDGMVTQGWDDCAVPVLWSEWSQDGILLRQEVFAHIPGAKDVVTGIEPLFAWIRLSIRQTCRDLPLEEKYGFLIKINAPHVHLEMDTRYNITFLPELSLYPRKLSQETEGYDPNVGYRILEEGEKVRLAVAPGQRCAVDFKIGDPTENDYLLYVKMDVKEGNHVDILLPILPTDRNIFDQELALGYDRAFREADRYWGKIPDTAAVVDTPEEHINQTIRQGLKFAEIIAEKNPADGNYSLLTGSLQYPNLWATPASMTLIMLLDTMGYHSSVEKYLEIFKQAQSMVTPPGRGFRRHPGYLGTPRSLASVDWLTDHGAIIYAISEHALLSGDQRFTHSWTDTIVKACDFIKDARRERGHEGAPGIMPPAIASDMKTGIQAVWSDGWNYKGLATAVKLLKRINHPRADEFAKEVNEYRTAFANAIRRTSSHIPPWTDLKGKKHAFAPMATYGDVRGELRDECYLDSGPLFLVFAGLLDANDELMRSALLWFREGPQTQFYRRDSNCHQVACLDHEMSSGEPCYSWNVFHSHQLGDRLKFLEGMYSLFAGCVSRKTFTMCENRGGIYGMTPALLPVYLARLSVIDDQLKEGELHLLRLVPLAWLRSDRATEFKEMPTEFGPVTLEFKLSSDERTLRVSFGPRFRITPKRIVFHIPPKEGLRRITLNGRGLGWDGKKHSVVFGLWRPR